MQAPSVEEMLKTLDSSNGGKVIRDDIKMVGIDVETLGIDPDRFGITQLAVIIDVNGQRVAQHTFLMRPKGTLLYDITQTGKLESGIPYDPKALEVQGRTPGQVMSYPEEDKVHEDLLEFLGCYIDKYDPDDKAFFLAYNAQFDDQHLRAHFKRCEDDYYGSWFNKRLLDPMHLIGLLEYMGKYELHETRKLKAMCEYFEVPLENAHDAMADITATYNLWYKLLTDIQLRRIV